MADENKPEPQDDPPPTETWLSQEALETADFADPQDIRLTAVSLEHSHLPPNEVQLTAVHLEHLHFPPNETWASQVVLEVAFPAVVEVNYAYFGSFARTA